MDDPQYMIRKGGYYYRPGAAGYTLSKADAGRYTLADAVAYSHPNGPDGPRDGITYELDGSTAQPDDVVGELSGYDREAAGQTAERIYGTLCFKSEYTTTLENPRRYQVDAYCVESGEYFHGGAKSSSERGNLMVEPVDITTAALRAIAEDMD